MKLNEIIKALEEKEIEGDVITAIKDLDQGEQVSKLTKELEAEKGKHSGILEDKKKFKERAEQAEKSLKEQEDSKLSVEERTQNQIDELNQKLADAEDAKVKQENDFKAAQRETALADITSSVKWSASIPHDTARLIVREAFKGVDDLGKENVAATVKELTETHKAFISAEAPGGTGGKSGSKGGPPGDDTVLSHKEIQSDIWKDK